MSSTNLSWVLAAEDPQRLAGFYAALLECPQEQGFSGSHWIVEPAGGCRLEIYRPSRQRPFPLRGRALAPCLRLAPSKAPLEHLQQQLPAWIALGASLIEPARLRIFVLNDCFYVTGVVTSNTPQLRRIGKFRGHNTQVA